ncbi:NAD(P)H-binding protein [Jatrophihabitans sp.]|uniref:NAD(P)H-binding protein n=1 Tax=Jatrophihabitans sp. TaxID=1932789 RepID=UPI0030C701D2|nr:hypothetical protein [Jatrophihabitans sp.]
MSDITTVLVVGASGSTGRLVVEEALQRGLTTRALVHDPDTLPLDDEPQHVLADIERLRSTHGT